MLQLGNWTVNTTTQMINTAITVRHYLLATSLLCTNILSGYLRVLKDSRLSFTFGSFSELDLEENHRLRQVHVKIDLDEIQTFFFKFIIITIILDNFIVETFEI